MYASGGGELVRNGRGEDCMLGGVVHGGGGSTVCGSGYVRSGAGVTGTVPGVPEERWAGASTVLQWD